MRHASFWRARAPSSPSTQLDLDAGLAQPLDPAPSLRGFGSRRRRRRARRPRRPPRRRTAACARGARTARASRTASRRARVARLLERDDLGVRPARALVPALADDLAVADDDGADDRVRVRRAAAALGELERALEAFTRSAWTSRRYARGGSSAPKIDVAGDEQRRARVVHLARCSSAPMPPSTWMWIAAGSELAQRRGCARSPPA